MSTFHPAGMLLLGITALAFTGCAHKYYLHPIQRTEALSKDASVLVALPADGSFEKIQYPGSGRQAARAVATAFGKHVKRVDIMDKTGSQAEQLAAAREGNFDLLASPVVSHWEDRATEWSGRRDRIEIELRTLRVADGATLSIGSIEGRSRWGTLGGDSPEDL